MLKRLSKTGRSRSGESTPVGLPSNYVALPSAVDELPDSELTVLNGLLPWSAFTLDRHGRRFGTAHSDKKRALAQVIPDPRITEFNRRYGLKNRRVLEIGCFEGIHTIALAHLGATVTAVDGRIENVAKTAVRCAMYNASAQLGCWDVEGLPPAGLSLDCELLHHVGVLYHLKDPIAHLARLLPHVSHALMLDTHVAPKDSLLQTYESSGQRHRFYTYNEGGRKDPFSGMYDHAKWLVEAELVAFLNRAGLQVESAERRNERNGPRVLIFAQRTDRPGSTQPVT